MGFTTSLAAAAPSIDGNRSYCPVGISHSDSGAGGSRVPWALPSHWQQQRRLSTETVRTRTFGRSALNREVCATPRIQPDCGLTGLVHIACTAMHKRGYTTSVFFGCLVPRNWGWSQKAARYWSEWLVVTHWPNSAYWCHYTDFLYGV